MKQLKNETEILGLITKMQEQLTALDKKIDALMMRALVTSPNAPSVQKPVQKQVPMNREKPLYQIICADCKKESSIPFKPSGDRPVYCKECFSRRRNGNGSNLVQVTPPVQIVKEEITAAPAAKEDKKKKAPAKKAVTKKKPVTKKKKK